MNELTNEIEYQLSKMDEFNKDSAISFPLDSLISRVPVFSSLADAAAPLFKDKSKGGLMWVDAKGGNLFKKKGTNKFIGNIATENGAVGGGIAELTPMSFNPEAMIIAAATASIVQKMDEIKEIQTDMFDFLKINDEANLKGELKFLIDSFNKIMINYDDKNFIDSIKSQLNDASKAAFVNVEKYKLLIEKEADKKQFIHFQGDVNKKIKELRDQLSKYQLSVYMYSLSQYLLVRVNESRNKEYLEDVASTIENLSLEYRDSYSRAFDALESFSKNSGEQLLLSGVSTLEKFTGNLINKVPILKNNTLGDKIIKQSEKANEHKSSIHNQSLGALLDKQKAQVMPYIENIRLMSHVYNDDVQIGLDKDNLYITNNSN